MKLDSLYSRIALVFALVSIGFGALLGWPSYNAAKVHQHAVMQQLSRELASHIVNQGPLIGASGIDRKAVDELFHMATAVNPMIEIYLLDGDGLIVTHSPPGGDLPFGRVSLEPIHAFIAGKALPVRGDSSRAARRKEIFSVAPILLDTHVSGYLYVVLVGGMYRQMADEAEQSFAVRSAVWVGTVGLALALLVGLAAFGRITRPLNRLARTVPAFERDNPESEPRDPGKKTAPGASSKDEIGRLATAFFQMTERLKAHMGEIRRHDQLRRELVANVSHDLRTPLTSMQNYLETLLRTGDDLPAAERRHYIEVAVRQCHSVTKLAEQLFELAQLECEETLPHAEVFSLAELLQDVGQKFALLAAKKQVRLSVEADPEGLFVHADIGMIERVIANLIDNAIRHTPPAGAISLKAISTPAGIEVRVADTGVGIATEYLPGLFGRDSPLRQTAGRAGGGLGLRIAERILALHGARMAVASESGHGTTFRFALPAVQPR